MVCESELVRYVSMVLTVLERTLPEGALTVSAEQVAKDVADLIATDIRTILAGAENADEELRFGKHKGKNYAQVFLEAPEYFGWILSGKWVNDDIRECMTKFLEAAKNLGIDTSVTSKPNKKRKVEM